MFFTNFKSLWLKFCDKKSCAGHAARLARDRNGFRSFAGLCWLVLASVSLWGCRTLPSPGAVTSSGEATTHAASSSNHPPTVVTNIPSRPLRLGACGKFNPVWWFGNADDPVAPESYRPGKCCRNAYWRLRNPCHNFTFYVMGVADKPFTRVGRFAQENFHPNRGWNWAGCRYKCLRLPFLSYRRGVFKFYCGWRERGNFGMKFSFAGEKKLPTTKPQEPGPATETKSHQAF